MFVYRRSKMGNRLECHPANSLQGSLAIDIFTGNTVEEYEKETYFLHYTKSKDLLGSKAGQYDKIKEWEF